MLNYLKKHPGDAESLYGLTVSYAQKHDIVKAVDYLKQAIDTGRPCIVSHVSQEGLKGEIPDRVRRGGAGYTPQHEKM